VKNKKGSLFRRKKITRKVESKKEKGKGGGVGCKRGGGGGGGVGVRSEE